MFKPRNAGVSRLMAELLGADVADQVRRAVRVAVDVAVEAGHALCQGSPIIRGVELLLREGGVTNSRSPSNCFGFSRPLNNWK